MAICVVHLVRRGNSHDHLERFVRSYLAYHSGMHHELIILFKGFDGKAPAESERVLAGVPHARLFVSDAGFDVTAYARSAEELDCEYLCFLNSYSEILDDDWLAKLHAAVRRANVGIVGATGSWQSSLEHFRGYVPKTGELAPPPPLWNRLVARAHLGTGIVRRIRRYERSWRWGPFPNPHIRTNAFMLSKELFVSVKMGVMRKKLDTYVFESGRNSLTQQLLKRDLGALVVSRTGEAFEPQDWYKAETFWRNQQGGLLVADNMTRMFDACNSEKQGIYSYLAWGPHASPGVDA